MQTSLPARLFALLLAPLGAVLFTVGAPGASASSLLIQGGTLIDGTGKAPIANANVLIVDNTISRVWSGGGDQNVPPGTRTLDARGKYIIPGLIDSHTHYNWYMGELFLAHGVTTVYDLGNPLDWQSPIQKGLNSGKLRGPLYYHCTTLGGGGGDDPRPGIIEVPARTGFSLKTAADAKDAVAWVKGKADCITLNENWKDDYFTEVAREAHAAGLRVISHSYHALNSASWGVDGIEHMTGVAMAAVRSEAGKKAMAAMTIEAGHKNSLLYQYMDRSYFDEMIRYLIGHKVFINPTLDFEWKGIIDRTPQFEMEDQRLLYNPDLQYVPIDDRLVTLGQYHWADKRSISDREQFARGYRNVQEFLRKFVAAGGKIYSGTDSAAANTPGLALHHEMQLYVDAGIPPMAALLSSTKWAAEIIGLDYKLGTVEPDKVANIVILRANPLEDIADTKSVETVVRNGEIADIGYHSDYEVPFHQYGPITKHLYNQPPKVRSVEPAVGVQGTTVRLRISGANFVPNSVVMFRGRSVETQFVSPTELFAVLTPTQTAEVGNYLIAVQTPKPGGGLSGELGFIVDYP
jgi:Amidohydrolase family/IPT/TIG domain